MNATTRARTARDYMSTNLVTFGPGTDIHRAIKSLLSNEISGAPVIDDQGTLLGVLSIKDCLKVAFSASYHREWGGVVADYMSGNPEIINADTDIVEVAELFLKSRFRRFPVMERGRLVGQISRYDVLRALEELW